MRVDTIVKQRFVANILFWVVVGAVVLFGSKQLDRFIPQVPFWSRFFLLYAFALAVYSAFTRGYKRLLLCVLVVGFSLVANWLWTENVVVVVASFVVWVLVIAAFSFLSGLQTKRNASRTVMRPESTEQQVFREEAQVKVDLGSRDGRAGYFDLGKTFDTAEKSVQQQTEAIEVEKKKIIVELLKLYQEQYKSGQLTEEQFLFLVKSVDPKYADLLEKASGTDSDQSKSFQPVHSHKSGIRNVIQS